MKLTRGLGTATYTEDILGTLEAMHGSASIFARSSWSSCLRLKQLPSTTGHAG